MAIVSEISKAKPAQKIAEQEARLNTLSDPAVSLFLKGIKRAQHLIWDVSQVNGGTPCVIVWPYNNNMFTGDKLFFETAELAKGFACFLGMTIEKDKDD